MDKDYILNDKEYEIFKQFSIKMTQNTKKDYFSVFLYIHWHFHKIY